MQVNKRTSPLFLGDVINRLLKVVEVRLVELGTETVRERAHALEEEGDAEQVDFVLICHDVDPRAADEGVIDAKPARETGSDLRGCAPRAKLAAGFGDAGVEDGSRGSGEERSAGCER